MVLQLAEPADDTFLFEVYSSTRLDELRAWGWDAAQQNLFLEFQFRTQQTHYQARFPNAYHHIIIRDGIRIGHMVVDHSPHAIVLVDIALLPTAQGAGIGTWLIQQLQTDASLHNTRIELTVLKGNRAESLYRRLGFEATNEDELSIRMLWQPTISI